MNYRGYTGKGGPSAAGDPPRYGREAVVPPFLYPTHLPTTSEAGEAGRGRERVRGERREEKEEVRDILSAEGRIVDGRE